MYICKGFVKYPSLINNRVNQTAPIGELSPVAMTYAREIGEYRNTDYPTSSLVAFHSELDDEVIEVPDFLSKLILEIAHWQYNNATEGHFTRQKGDYSLAFNDRFAEKAQQLQLGDMVEVVEGQYFPEWIGFKATEPSYDSYFRIWFAGESFNNQYDEHDIAIIPPVDNIDIFFSTVEAVDEALGNFNPVILTQRINTVADKEPYTLLRTENYTWHQRQNPQITRPTYWTALLYGPGANSADLIKQAFIRYIKQHSTYREEDWAVIFPDIFSNTEFIITPLWSQYAIPNKTIQSGMYSPIISPRKAIDLAKKTLKGVGYNNAHVDDHLELFPLAYKSLSATIVGASTNRDNHFNLYAKYVDYLDVPTSSRDFGRMALSTQYWVLFIMELLKAAEEISPSSAIPINFNRIERDGIIYAAGSYGNTQYLAVSAWSMAELDTPHFGDKPTQGQHPTT